MRLRDLLVGNLGVVVDGRSLGDQGEPVEKGEEETNDRESDCISAMWLAEHGGLTYTWPKRDPRWR